MWRYPSLIVHRCGGALTPENTLAGLRLAARLGCAAVEFDAMLCADGVPVVIHDETFDRTTDGSGSVAEARLADLRSLDAGVRHGAAFRGEPLPTLEEMLAACVELGLSANIEIKPAIGHERETGAIVARLTSAWHGEWLLSSFSEAALAEAAAVAPQLPRALLVETVPADWRERLKRHGAIALHCAADGIDEQSVAAIVAAGYGVACYTVNSPTRARQLFAIGVAAVFSDRPDLFPAEKRAASA